jgi:hypothetical protein
MHPALNTARESQYVVFFMHTSFGPTFPEHHGAIMLDIV